MERRVVITGAGLISPLGDSREAFYSALCTEATGIGEVEQFEPPTPSCRWVGEVKGFSPTPYIGKTNLRPLNRTARLLVSAAQLALDDSNWAPVDIETTEVGLVVGTMFCSVHTISEFDRRALEAGPEYASAVDFSNTVLSAAGGQAAILLGFRGINATICSGMSSGVQALCYAADLIRSGRASAVLAGGVEELCFESFLGFHRAGLLGESTDGNGALGVPFATERNGFVQSEGAGLLMLEDLESARKRGATVIGEVKGHGSAHDHGGGEREDAAVESIANAVELAIADSKLGPGDIDCVFASANGSIRWDRLESLALRKVFEGEREDVPVAAVKSMTGEALGASGALQAIALLESLEAGRLPGIRGLDEPREAPAGAASICRELELNRGLINSIGLDGNCCAMVLERSAPASGPRTG